jgi:hypothetical protein
MSAAARFPDFLGIGVQKAATTWLDQMLRRHPALWLPPIKELQFFSELHLPGVKKWTVPHRHQHAEAALGRLGADPSDDGARRAAALLREIGAGEPTDAWYGRVFSAAPPERLCGEITPEYSLLPDEGIGHVLRLSPEVRIILSLRDPVERTWSHVRMMAKGRGLEEPAQIEAFLRQPNIWNDIIGRSDYPAILARWRARVPEQRLLILFTEDIAAAPDDVLERVCRFLGVESDPSLSRRAEAPVHVGPEMAMSEQLRSLLEAALESVYDRMAQQYPGQVAAWLERKRLTASAG